jgi:hypothetical protein
MLIHGGGVGYLGQYVQDTVDVGDGFVVKTWEWVAQQILYEWPDAIQGTPEHQLAKMTEKCRNYWSDAKKQNSPRASRRYSAMLSSAHGLGEWNTKIPVRWRDIHAY